MSQYLLLWETIKLYYDEKLRELTIMRNDTNILWRETDREYYYEKQYKHTMKRNR